MPPFDLLTAPDFAHVERVLCTLAADWWHEDGKETLYVLVMLHGY